MYTFSCQVFQWWFKWTSLFFKCACALCCKNDVVKYDANGAFNMRKGGSNWYFHKPQITPCHEIEFLELMIF